VVNDNSSDETRAPSSLCAELARSWVLIDNVPPRGFGAPFAPGWHFSGDVVALVMADHSDDPQDIVHCYRKRSKATIACSVRVPPRQPGAALSDVQADGQPARQQDAAGPVPHALQRPHNAFKMYHRSVLRGSAAAGLSLQHHDRAVAVVRDPQVPDCRDSGELVREDGGVSNLKLAEMGGSTSPPCSRSGSNGC